MTLGDIISQYRAAHDLSMDDFAELSGISKAYISMLEKNRTSRGNAPSPSIDIYRGVAKVLGVDVDELIRMVDGRISLVDSLPDNAFPYNRGRRISILGRIPAGVPLLAVENIEGYDYADVPEGDDYFYLRVVGDSMIGAGIAPGDLVLVRKQDTAENNQIVVCILNGDEATLKRFHRQADLVILQPENTKYPPIIVPIIDFETGYAKILGVAKELKRKL